jgi:hypothetical protein
MIRGVVATDSAENAEGSAGGDLGALLGAGCGIVLLRRIPCRDACGRSPEYCMSFSVAGSVPIAACFL